MDFFTRMKTFRNYYIYLPTKKNNQLNSKLVKTQAMKSYLSIIFRAIFLQFPKTNSLARFTLSSTYHLTNPPKKIPPHRSNKLHHSVMTRSKSCISRKATMHIIIPTHTSIKETNKMRKKIKFRITSAFINSTFKSLPVTLTT